MLSKTLNLEIRRSSRRMTPVRLTGFMRSFHGMRPWQAPSVQDDTSFLTVVIIFVLIEARLSATSFLQARKQCERSHFFFSQLACFFLRRHACQSRLYATQKAMLSLSAMGRWSLSVIQKRLSIFMVIRCFGVSCFRKFSFLLPMSME